MENASKALIIAGSILIAIVIISLGVMIFRNMSGAVKNEANLDQQAIASFNADITPYLGNNVTGANVNVLIQRVIAINNVAIKNQESYKYVTLINYDSKKIEVTGNTLSRGFSNVNSANFYHVKGDYDNNGLITTITITE